MTKKNSRPCVLTIAGSDSSGGAGIQADIKTITVTGSYAATVITALTAQNTRGVKAIANVNPTFIQQQLEAVFSDLKIQAVKIGMLHRSSVIDVVAAILKKYQPPHIILDPVMLAKNGHQLLQTKAIYHLQQKLFSLVDLITPNLLEAEKILNIAIHDQTTMQHAARKMSQLYQTNVLIKGGHLNARESNDVLCIFPSLRCYWLEQTRIHSKNTHGTGCTLSSAIASYLAQGYTLYKAIQQAKKYLTQALQASMSLRIGKGYGPVDHLIYR